MGIPHRCPVCDGKGRVGRRFYSDEPKRVICRSCDGRGILWSYPYSYTWTSGYNCATCGGWVGYGQPHTCPVQPSGQFGYTCPACGIWVGTGVHECWTTSPSLYRVTWTTSASS